MTMSNILSNFGKKTRDAELMAVGLKAYIGKSNSEIKEACKELHKIRLQTRAEIVQAKKDSVKASEKNRHQLALEVIDKKLERLVNIMNLVTTGDKSHG